MASKRGIDKESWAGTYTTNIEINYASSAFTVTSVSTFCYLKFRSTWRRFIYQPHSNIGSRKF